MRQSTSHPWSLIPVDRVDSKYFIFFIKDQFLRDGERLISRCTAAFMDAVIIHLQIIALVLTYSILSSTFLSCVCEDSTLPAVSEGTIFDQRCYLTISKLVFPCQSSGQYLRAALESLMRCSYSNPLRQVSLYSTNPRLNSEISQALRWVRASLDLTATRVSPPCFPSCICHFDMARKSIILLNCSLC